MFEQLFGSKTRVKLIKVFLDNPEKKFFVRELTRLTDSLINSIRRELDNLVNLKIIQAEEAVETSEDEKPKKKGLNIKKFYSLNTKNLFLQDLTNLFNKGKILLEKKLVEKVKRLGDIHYMAFGGLFIDNEADETDVVLIGDFNVAKAKESFKKFEKELGKEIRYTLLTAEEYNLRKDIADNFLESIMDNDGHIIIINKLAKKKIDSKYTEIIS